MHALVSHTLASALATAGTVAIAYPAGYSKGNFVFGAAHKIVALQYTWQAPRDFTIALGNTTFTITWKATATLPAGTDLRVQLDIPGDKPVREEGPRKRALHGAVSAMVLALVSLGTPATADPDGYCASQDLTSAGVASVSGTAAAAIAAAALAGQADVPRNVVAAWTGAAVLTVTGEDKYGNVMVEKSASGTSFTGKKAFYKVTSFSVSANVTALTIGTGNVLGLPMFLPSKLNVVHEIQDGALLPRKPTKVVIPGRVLCTDGTYGVAVSPFAGTIIAIDTVEIEGSIATNNAVLTFKIGTTAITNGAVTVATSGSAAGVKDSAAPTAANVLAAGDAINVTVSGTPGGGKSVAVAITVELDETMVYDGTVLAGDTTQPIATSGDVRGTYAPADAPNGSRSYALMIGLADPGLLGGAQYAG